MPKVPTRLLIPLLAMLALPACVSAPLSVTTQPTGCAALLPPSWLAPVLAPDFAGDGNTVADWQVYADSVTGRLDQANDRTVAAIGIVQRCEARDAAAIHRATRHKILGLF